MRNRTPSLYEELASLFFGTRQIIRDNLKGKKPDPNAWLRYETLRIIAEAHEPTMQAVAKRLRIKAPSATSLVAHLIKSGWIAHVKHAGDRRVVRIALTAKGKRAFEGYRTRSAATMRRVFSKLDASDAKRLVRILRAVKEAHE